MKIKSRPLARHGNSVRWERGYSSRECIMNQLVIIVSAMLLVTTVFGCGRKAPLNEASVERGKYLVTFGECNDCHTPKMAGPGSAPEFDAKHLLSGHPENAPYPVWTPGDAKRNVLIIADNTGTAFAGPWGVSFAMNLTPDKGTGIGEWSETTFIEMMRTGKHQGQPNGRDILPPMPWFNIKALTDADLKAIWAYLRSIPSVENQVPLPIAPATSENHSQE
jgi:mono/diheme cytochrome c family protein